MGGTIRGAIERRVLVKVCSTSQLMWLRLPSWNLFIFGQMFHDYGRMRSGGCGVRYRGNNAGGHVKASIVGILPFVGQNRLSFREP